MTEKRDLMSNNEFVQKMIDANSEEELINILKENGVEIDSKKLQTVLGSYRPEEVQLTAEQLERVVGGSFFGDFWQGFKFGFTSPVEAIGVLIANI